jgi:hypothetical protein
MRLYSQPGNDMTRRFPLIVEATTCSLTEWWSVAS